MLEIVTYNSKEAKSYLEFSLFGSDLNEVEINKILNLVATRVIYKKEPVPIYSSWKFRVNVDDHIDFKSAINTFLDTFFDRILLLLEIKSKLCLNTKLDFVINIRVDPKESTPYFPMDLKFIEFLHKTKTVVDYDIYKVE